MKLVRQGIIHFAYVALLIEGSACMSSTDTQGVPGQVEATGEAHDLRFSKKHKKKKHKHHSDDSCEPNTCESVELHVDSHHREDTKELDGEIRVEIPRTLPALYWGSDVSAELTFEHGDESVVCTYEAGKGKRRGSGRSLEFVSCDNGAKASDVITFDSATLELACSSWSPFAKVHVKLHELEPCGETMCDPTMVDDGDPCTVDACAADGSVTHTPAADGTSCDDGNVCNGVDCCQAGKCVKATNMPMECGEPERKVVFSTNFEADMLPNEVSPGLAMRVPVQEYEGIGNDERKFSGYFLQSPTGNRVTLKFEGLPEHDKIDFKWLLAAIDSLDGTGPFPAGEEFIIRLDDVVIFRESLANARVTQIQTYVPPPGVELARRVNLGFAQGNDYNDSAYDMGKDPAFLGLVHTASTATFTFEYVGPGIQMLESWAMESVEVSVSKASLCEDCGGIPPVTDDNNPCTVDSCDPKLGVRHVPVDAGTSCGDGSNKCTGAPTCNAEGMCVPGTPLTCDDGDVCNGVEQCDPASGCVSGTPRVCADDGDPCNGAEMCDRTRGCVSGPELKCDDNNACNGSERCIPMQGCISGTAPLCNNNNVCDGVEQCDPATGICSRGMPLEEDDMNECTIDMCDPITGVGHEFAGDDTRCNGGNGLCDGAGNCEDLT